MRDARGKELPLGERLRVIRRIHLTDEIVKAMKKSSAKAKNQARDYTEAADSELLAEAFGNVSAVARALGRSVSGLTHELRKRYNVTFSQLLARARVEHAEAVMLRTPEAGISEIAMAVGFDNISYFSTIFRKYAGMTPVEYRSMVGRK